MRNAFAVGGFGFYRDPGLTEEITSVNLFDQITPDGWIDMWFGGKDVFIPEIGKFHVHVFADTTFFWDVVDENGKRTKDGLERMWISRNPNMRIWYGDLIPHDQSLFGNGTNALIAANLWFYNNLFRDGYFRYYLVLIPSDHEWPDEQNAIEIPMSDTLEIPNGYKIVGYRPKPEYRYQLAVTPVIRSGIESSIHFRFKVDLDWLFANPSAKRYVRIFTASGERPGHMLYPDRPEDLIWKMYPYQFVPEYRRYLLDNGIQQRLPRKDEIEEYKKLRERLLLSSNLLDVLDSYNISYEAERIRRKLYDPGYELRGIAKTVFDDFVKWYRPKEPDGSVGSILEYVVLRKFPYRGFQKVNEIIDGVEPPPPVDDFRPAPKRIVEIDGVKQFEDGYVPKNALEYKNPPDGYVYAGTTGDGMYLIMVNGKPTPVLCLMREGWMLLVDPLRSGREYVERIFGSLPEHLVVDDYGISFGTAGEYERMSANIAISEVRAVVFDKARECGSAELKIYTDTANVVDIKNEGCGSTCIVGTEVLYSGNREDKANDIIVQTGSSGSVSMAIRGEESVRKYVKFLYAR